MPYNSEITKVEMDKLLNHLEYFQNPDSIFYGENNGWLFESDEVIQFRNDLDETGFLLVFDWGEWISKHEVYKDINNSIDDMMKMADLETLRKLMTSYIRGDRFNEGFFINVILKGHITNILLRLKELRECM